MIRTLTHSNRRWRRVLFLLFVCAGLGLAVDRVAADPGDLAVFEKRPSLRGPMLGLSALLYERPIVIGPVPGIGPGRTPRRHYISGVGPSPQPRRHYIRESTTPRGPRSAPQAHRNSYQFSGVRAAARPGR